MKHKLVPNAYNTIGKNLADTTQEEFFMSTLDLYMKLGDLYASLLTTEEATEKNMSLDDLLDDQIVFLENCDGFVGMTDLKYIADSSPLAIDGHNEHLRNAILTAESVLTTISDIVLAGSILSDESVVELRESVTFILSELIYVLLYSFGFYKALEVEGDNPVEIQVQVAKVLEKSSKLSFTDWAKHLYEQSEIHKVKLKVFELNPELEDKFYDSVGLYQDTFMINEMYLTEDFVKLIISEEEELEAIVTKFLLHVEAEKAKEVERPY